MSDKYINSKVTVTLDVTDATSPFVAADAPSMQEIDEGVSRDLTLLLTDYFTSFDAYDVTVNDIDVIATHRLVEKAEAKA